MNEAKDELHNDEKAGNLRDAILLFLALVIVVGLIGVVFWVAV